ncbi:hypothetical protein [Breznakia pachnodae]|uniref:Uncharacterized protein n=1 Tax=Breznakia pachnodae TaxID=265178 RepID=A0ABU0E3Z7_9FIRM|nr:hypothetical protein [Breznakia pachnodae]MDQ0361617.1 hypothetical protein [Breznakia pachnodae]
MKTYTIKLTQTFVWEEEFEANTKEEAISIAAKHIDGFWGVADATTLDKERYEIVEVRDNERKIPKSIR